MLLFNVFGDIIILHIHTINDNHMVPEIWRATDRIFVIQDRFLPFYARKDSENNNFGKMGKKTKKPEDIIILQMCTEKWSATDRMFCHLGPFFSLLPR